MLHDYDVAFSFAGEQRPYVEKVYGCLVSRGIRVFYDGGRQYRSGAEISTST
jgi:hypothetical protein